jgi:hypothetical protein
MKTYGALTCVPFILPWCIKLDEPVMTVREVKVRHRRVSLDRASQSTVCILTYFWTEDSQQKYLE